MAVTQFRPTVYPLEARDVPASGVTPTQVFTAISYIEQTPAILTYLQDNLDLARVGGAGQALLTSSDVSRGAADTLNKFIQDAREAAAANPANAATLNGLVASSAQLVATANGSAVAAEALANRLGVFRPAPPPPPVTGVGDTNIVPQPDQNPATPVPIALATDGSRLTTTLPPLTDPGFAAVGTQGLRVKDVVVGDGAAVTSTSTAQVRYRGFLASDGSLFDSNPAPKALLPAVVGPTPSVIQGFAQGLVGMRVGGIRDIDIPSDLAYGSRALTGIPANSRLVFEVQVVSAS